MAMLLGPETAYAKEMAKWEPFPSQWGGAGRPYTFQEFPKRLYKAERNAAGRIVIADAQTARDDHEERNLLSRGFCFGQEGALAAIEKEQQVHGELAAERNFEIKHGRLSEAAAAEVRAAEAEHGARHLPVVAETPIPAHRKRGRKMSPVNTGA